MTMGSSRRIALLLAVLVLAPVTSLSAQQPSSDRLDDSFNDFLDGALRININARIVDSEADEAVWAMDLTRVTIGGRSVRVRLDGTNIVVVADFTPYWESDDELVLVAQGQTWVTERGGSGETTYRTSFTTLPIRLGEPIVFFPLGSAPGTDLEADLGADLEMDLDTDHLGQLNIELEIYVERYQS
jgi:hypothetical protein